MLSRPCEFDGRAGELRSSKFCKTCHESGIIPYGYGWPGFGGMIQNSIRNADGRSMKQISEYLDLVETDPLRWAYYPTSQLAITAIFDEARKLWMVRNNKRRTHCLRNMR